MKRFILPALLFLMPFTLFAHNVTSIIHKGDTVISAAEDGFITIWDVSNTAAKERFQLTPYRITAMARNPVRDEISIVEAVNMDLYRVSAWDFAGKNRLFSVLSRSPVTYINYSAGGNFLIVSGFDATLLLLDSTTGEIVSVLDIPEGNVTLAITGRAERNMLVYQSSHDDFMFGFEGQILYVDLEANYITGRFNAPGGLNPIIFGNNRYLAGINRDGLLLIDAATGDILDSIDNARSGALLFPDGDGFFYLETEGLFPFLQRYSVNLQGRLVGGLRLSLSLEDPLRTSVYAFNRSHVFAANDGSLFLIQQRGGIIPFTFNTQTRITEIAFSGNSLAFLTEHSDLAFIPLDFRLLEDGKDLTKKRKTGFTHLTPFDEENDAFILWQNSNTRLSPRIINSNHQVSELNLSFMINRFPLRSISAGNRTLVLDSAGNISLYNLENNTRPNFTFSAIGAIDAAIVDNKYFIISRSAIMGASLFLFVSYLTGETIPVHFPAEAGIMVYAGSSGRTYAAVIERGAEGTNTILLKLSLLGAVEIFRYPGESPHLSIAESAGILAIVCGGEGARIFLQTYDDDFSAVNFERTSGLAVKLLGAAEFFIALDSEGNISWHDNQSGELLAVFSLHDDRWTLTSDTEISGGVAPH